MSSSNRAPDPEVPSRAKTHGVTESRWELPTPPPFGHGLHRPV